MNTIYEDDTITVTHNYLQIDETTYLISDLKTAKRITRPTKRFSRWFPVTVPLFLASIAINLYTWLVMPYDAPEARYYEYVSLILLTVGLILTLKIREWDQILRLRGDHLREDVLITGGENRAREVVKAVRLAIQASHAGKGPGLVG